MSLAVVFDSAGTLLNTYRVAKDIRHKKLLPGIETTTLTFSSPDRVLVVLPVHSKDIINTPGEVLLSSYLAGARREPWRLRAHCGALTAEGHNRRIFGQHAAVGSSTSRGV